jgi:hypothetical protein
MRPSRPSKSYRGIAAADRFRPGEPATFLYSAAKPPNMYPLQASLDASMAVVLLGIGLVFVIIFAFIWAFKKISQPPEDLHEHNGHGA